MQIGWQPRRRGQEFQAFFGSASLLTTKRASYFRIRSRFHAANPSLCSYDVHKEAMRRVDLTTLFYVLNVLRGALSNLSTGNRHVSCRCKNFLPKLRLPVASAQGLCTWVTSPKQSKLSSTSLPSSFSSAIPRRGLSSGRRNLSSPPLSESALKLVVAVVFNDLRTTARVLIFLYSAPRSK